MDLPNNQAHKQFLLELDIDGISDHTQLFQLDREQVNQIVRKTVMQRLKQMNMKELLKPKDIWSSAELDPMADILREQRKNRHPQ